MALSPPLAGFGMGPGILDLVGFTIEGYWDLVLGIFAFFIGET